MVAPAVLRRRALAAAAVAAAAILVGLALHGERRQSPLGRFEAAGLMAHVAPATVSEVEVTAGGRRRRFVRDGAVWRAAEPAAAISADAGARIETGLRLLHVSPPERVLTGEELAAQGSFGLDSPALRVAVKGTVAFAVAFGAANPIGLARYARVEGGAGIALIPGYVAQAWEEVIAVR